MQKKQIPAEYIKPFLSNRAHELPGLFICHDVFLMLVSKSKIHTIKKLSAVLRCSADDVAKHLSGDLRHCTKATFIRYTARIITWRMYGKA